MHEGGDGHTYDASISVPLIEDVLAASLTAGASQDPGLAEGIDLPGRDLDEVDRWYARLKVLWEPSDELSITGSFSTVILTKVKPAPSMRASIRHFWGALAASKAARKSKWTCSASTSSGTPASPR